MHFDEPLFSGAKSAILFCVVSRHGQAIFYTGAVASYIIITTLILRHLARRDRGDSFTSLRYKKKKCGYKSLECLYLSAHSLRL